MIILLSSEVALFVNKRYILKKKEMTGKRALSNTNVHKNRMDLKLNIRTSLVDWHVFTDQSGSLV